MPSMSKAGFPAKASTSTMLFLIVPATWPPTPTQPASSMTAAMHMAWRYVSDLADTLVAHELATSLAPRK